MPLLIAIVLVACSKTENSEPDFSELKKEFVGKWIETGECEGCREVEFTSKEQKVKPLISFGGKVETMPLSVISKDLIQVKRDIDGQLMETVHGLIFHEDGTLEIKNFVRGLELVVYTDPSDVKNFHPLLLKRIK